MLLAAMTSQHIIALPHGCFGKHFQSEPNSVATRLGRKTPPSFLAPRVCSVLTRSHGSGWVSTSVPYSSSITRTGLALRLPSATTSTGPTPSRRRTATRSSCVMPMSSAILSAGLCCGGGARVHGFSLGSSQCYRRNPCFIWDTLIRTESV